ncbi:MAG: DsbA family oxidoreductase [Betaproteobacteria bacterium]|nr:DsbA family oxidoreductase [Betaproteobacteria bacterium]
MNTTTLRIDFVSDVSCPWCAIGLGALEAALTRLAPQIEAELHFQPFELNPEMPVEGQDAIEHLTQKYRISAAQAQASGEVIRKRGESVGFVFDMQRRERVWNTFDAHRLLHWAELQDLAKQRALKKALFKAYFTDGLNPSDRRLLVQLAQACGLDAGQAAQILASEAYSVETRQCEHFYTNAGIHSVPAVIVNNRHLISGGQPAEVFEEALRKIAAEDQ